MRIAPCLRCGHLAQQDSSYCTYCLEVFRVCYRITEKEYEALKRLCVTVPEWKAMQKGVV